MSHACHELPHLRHFAGAAVPLPRYVCEACGSRASSANGRPLSFSNVVFDGDYIANYTGTGKAYVSHDCWIDSIACRADEAQFGGIVIEVRRDRG